jgi:hypothetical protein
VEPKELSPDVAGITRHTPKPQHSLGLFRAHFPRPQGSHPQSIEKQQNRKNKSMSPRNSAMLVNEVLPRLRKAAHSIPKIPTIIRPIASPLRKMSPVLLWYKPGYKRHISST